MLNRQQRTQPARPLDRDVRERTKAPALENLRLSTTHGYSVGGFRNRLYFGDNLDVLRRHIKDETVTLVYLDPPFNSKANYDVLYKEPSGRKSVAQVQAFEDTWRWGPDATSAFDEVLRSRTSTAGILHSLHTFLGPTDLMAYLTMMTIRFIELHRVLKPTGSLYLHCDSTASHYLRIILDAIFGVQNFRNEILWKRNSAHSDSRQEGPDSRPAEAF